MFRDLAYNRIMTLEEAVWQDDERMSGAVCFRNTRVPLYVFWDHLEAGHLNEFYDGYPNVSREQVEAVLREARLLLDSKVNPRKSA